MSVSDFIGDLLSGGQVSAGKAQLAGINSAIPKVQQGYTDAQGNIVSGYGGAKAALQPLADQSAGVYGALANKTAQGGFNVNTPGFDATAFGNNFQADPGYQFAKQQGLEAVNANAEENGNRDSGSTMKALENYGTGLANQQYNQQYQRAQDTQMQNNQLALQNAGQQFGEMSQVAAPAFGVAGQLANTDIGQGTAEAGLNTGLATDLSNLAVGQGNVNAQIAAAPYAGVNSLLGKAADAGVSLAKSAITGK